MVLYRSTILLVTILLVACATPKEYRPPPKALLQEPLPGQALLYMLRSPYDGQDLQILINGKRVTALPSSTYTVMSLAPGQYALESVGSKQLIGGLPDIPQIQLSLKPAQRVFIHLPAPEYKYAQGTSVMSLPGELVIPQSTRRPAATGATRAWTITEEQDVHWFIHYSKLYLER